MAKMTFKEWCFLWEITYNLLLVFQIAAMYLYQYHFPDITTFVNNSLHDPQMTMKSISCERSSSSILGNHCN